MTESYPRKYWWLILVVVPVVLALITILPGLRDDGGNAGNSIAIEGSSIEGDVQIIGSQVILNQLQQQELDPELARDLESRLQRATNLAQSGFYADAIALFEQIATQLPTPAVYHNLGSLYLLEQRDQQALASFKEGLARDPDYQPSRLSLAQLYRRQGDTRAAIEQLQRAPDQPQARALLQTLQQDIASGNAEQEPNNDILQPNLAPLNQPIEAALTPADDQDFYRITIPGPPRDLYQIELRNRTTALRPQVNLWAADKRHLWSNATHSSHLTPGQDVRHQFSASAGATYYLSVASLGGEGRYRVSVSARRAFDRFEPNDEIAQAHKLELATPTRANLMDAADRDFYRVRARQGALTLRLTTDTAGLRAQLQFWSGDKRHLWSSATHSSHVTPGQDVAHSLSVESGATYFVSVASLGGSGNYQLTVASDAPL